MDKIKPFSETISTGLVGEKDLSGTQLNFSTGKSSKKSSFQILKENRIPLTDEERTIIMKRRAIWHLGPGGKASPAVWKSKNSHGNVVYVTNTHRAYNTAPTLLGAIERYHKFIKSTASED